LTCANTEPVLLIYCSCAAFCFIVAAILQNDLNEKRLPELSAINRTRDANRVTRASNDSIQIIAYWL